MADSIKNVSVSPLMQIVRIGLLVFTIAFWITGFCLFVIGIWSTVELNKYDDLPSRNNYNSAAIILIVVGLMIACVGVCGCFGAVRKNTCLLKTFAVFLGVVILCEVCVAVAGYAYRSKIKHALSNGLNATMQEYWRGGVIQSSWDEMQENFHCCGNKNYSDWFSVTWSQTNSTEVPRSCCRNQDLQGCNKHVVSLLNATQWIYTKGCYNSITDFFQSKFSVLASGALAIALIQIIGISCSGCFLKHLQRKTNYELV